MSTDAAPRDAVEDARQEFLIAVSVSAHANKSAAGGSKVWNTDKAVANADAAARKFEQAIRAQATDEVKELVEEARAMVAYNRHTSSCRMPWRPCNCRYGRLRAVLQRFEGQGV